MAIQAASASSANEAAAGELGVMVTVALATMLAPLNSTMIAVALPQVIREFGVDVAAAGWLVTAYLIAMASLQPVAGKLGDRWGRRRLILGGVASFGLASIGAALSSSFASLLFFRVLQAVSGAIALPNGAALLREVVPAERRAGRFGMVGAAIALAAAAGPALGGLLVGRAGWRALFEVNLLLIVPTLLIGWRAVPDTSNRGAGLRFDVTGAVLLSAVLVGGAWLMTHGSNDRVTLVGVLALAALTAAFFRRELRHPDPVLQPRLFRHRTFAAANAAIALSNLAMYTTLLAIPILLSRRAGWRSAEVGLVLAVMSAGMVVFSPLGGRLADRLGRRWPTVAGLALLTIGLAPLALAGGAVATGPLLAGLGLAGAGLGLSAAGMQTAALESVGPGASGVASGVFSTSRYLGSIVGSSVLGGMLGTARDGLGGFGLVFVMAVGAALLSVLVSCGLHDRPHHAQAPA
jgi:EmrB/QacA subfamily drug resistance transporter